MVLHKTTEYSYNIKLRTVLQKTTNHIIQSYLDKTTHICVNIAIALVTFSPCIQLQLAICTVQTTITSCTAHGMDLPSIASYIALQLLYGSVYMLKVYSHATKELNNQISYNDSIYNLANTYVYSYSNSNSQLQQVNSYV